MQSDPVAERQVIAAALAGHPGVAEKFQRLPEDAFAHGLHATVAAVLRDKITRDAPIDALTIAADAAAATGTDHHAQRIHQFVLDCTMNPPPLESFTFYAETLLERRHLREISEHSQRLTHLAESATGANPADIGDLTTTMRSTLDALAEATRQTVADPPLSLRALLDEPTEPYDWLIPGLLERGDRLMLTGHEGLGKSMLVGQFAMSVAAGLHPFTAEAVARQGFRVLVIDCENSPSQVRRRYRNMLASVNYLRERCSLDPVDWSDQLRFLLRPEGIDITDAAEAARVEQAIALSAPDLVLAGPLYRLHQMDINEESAARDLVAALDRLRVRYRFALITEAHMGHSGESNGGRKLRPTGSSLFRRWPEFGYGLRPFGDAVDQEHPDCVELVAWRGARDDRRWPRLLKHGRSGLPWVPADTAYTREVQG